MRRHQIDIELYCDKSLEELNSSRINVEIIGENLYRISSSLQLFKSEIPGFVKRLIYRKFGKANWIKGLCSNPTGYIYSQNLKRN